MKFKAVINFADPQVKRSYLAKCGALQVPHKVEMAPYTPTRSNSFNRFYFGCVVKALIQFEAEQGEVWSKERAHAELVRKCLGEDELTSPDGEVVKVPKETHTLSTEDFAAYVERCIAWLADFGIVVQQLEQV